MADLLSEIEYGRILGSFTAVAEDSGDTVAPDPIPLNGTIKFVPSRSNVSYINSNGETSSLYVSPVNAVIHDGRIIGSDGNDGVTLLASNSNNVSASVLWTASISLNPINSSEPAPEHHTFLIEVRRGEVASLIDVIKANSRVHNIALFNDAIAEAAEKFWERVESGEFRGNQGPPGPAGGPGVGVPGPSGVPGRDGTDGDVGTGGNLIPDGDLESPGFLVTGDFIDNSDSASGSKSVRLTYATSRKIATKPDRSYVGGVYVKADQEVTFTVSLRVFGSEGDIDRVVTSTHTTTVDEWKEYSFSIDGKVGDQSVEIVFETDGRVVTADYFTFIDSTVIKGLQSKLDETRANLEQAMLDLDANLELADSEREKLNGSLNDLAVILENADVDLGEVNNQLDDLRDTIATEKTEREEANQAAQDAIQALDDKLADIGSSEELEGIRNDLTEALNAANAAQSTANEATTAANAASQAALEAAGIAASKGRVIVQEAEPQGEDRKASNIWIQPVEDDPGTDVEEKAITYVYLVGTDEWVPTTSSELAQAAQNALDARESAQQAQQRADTAIANASAAQAAAEAAQRTADEASLDAADAHNAAVNAQSMADAAQDRINSGLNLVKDPTRTKTTDGWTTNVGELTVESRDMGHGEVSALRSYGLANPGVYSSYFEIDPTQAYEFRMTFDKPVVNEESSRADFYLGIHSANVSSSLTEVDHVWADDGEYKSTNSNFYFYYKSGPFGGPTEVVGYVLPIGTDLSVAKGLGKNNQFNAILKDPSTTQMRMRWLNYDNEDVELPAWVSNVSVRASSVDDILRAKEAREAAEDAQARADEAYAEASSKPGMEEIQDAIISSANGKNSITVSPESPTGSGIAVGDVWWRIDGDGTVYGQWAWDGDSWVPRTISSEVIANLDVNKLVVAGSATINEAVINKIWADGISAKTITANKLVIASENLVPDPQGIDPEVRSLIGGNRWAWNDTDKYWTTEATSGGTTVSFNAFIVPDGGTNYDPVAVQPGLVYSIAYEVWVDAASESTGSRAAIYLKSKDGTTDYSGDGFGGTDEDEFNTTVLTPGSWNKITRSWEAPESALTAGFQFQIVSPPDNIAEVRIRNPRIVPKSGAVTIENGAISSNHITSDSIDTEHLRALAITADKIGANAIVAGKIDALAVNTRELAAESIKADKIAANAIIAGKVDADAIGAREIKANSITAEEIEAGSITAEELAVGAVTAEKIAVGAIDAEKISSGSFTGETFVGGTFTGGLFKTSDNLPGQVELADNGFVDPAAGVTFPGLRIIPVDTSDMVYPPGLGPTDKGMVISGGRDTSGSRGYTIMTPNGSQLAWRKGDAATSVQAREGLSNLTAEDGTGALGTIYTSTAQTYLRTTAADGSNSLIFSSPNGADLRVRNSADKVVAQVSASEAKVAIETREGGGVAGGRISSSVSGASVYRVNSSNMAVCGMWTENNETSIEGTDGTYVRGKVRVGSSGIIATSGRGMGFSVLDNGMTITGSTTVSGFTGSILRLETPPTASTSANTTIAGGGTNGIFFKISSSRRFKKNIADWNPEAERVLALQPRQWQHNDTDQPDNPNNLSEAWHVGFVAEEVDELGLNLLVKYEGDGRGGWRPDGLNYDRFAAAHQVVLRKHEDEIKSLEDKIDILLAELSEIKSKL